MAWQFPVDPAQWPIHRCRPVAAQAAPHRYYLRVFQNRRYRIPTCFVRLFLPACGKRRRLASRLDSHPTLLTPLPFARFSGALLFLSAQAHHDYQCLKCCLTLGHWLTCFLPASVLGLVANCGEGVFKPLYLSDPGLSDVSHDKQCGHLFFNSG